MEKITIKVKEDTGLRLDKFLSLETDFSRQYIQKLINNGSVSVNGEKSKVSYKVKKDDIVIVSPPEKKYTGIIPQKMDINIVYEDKDILIVDKPAGMVVHPGVGNVHNRDSLVNAVLYHCKDLSGIGGVHRPGIVHRLDKNTSGLLVLAKNDKAHILLSNQFKERKIHKEYIALVAGLLTPDKGRIEAPVGRDPMNRKKMAVVDESRGRMAFTSYRIIKKFKNYSLLRIRLHTGRMHQIRVHFASIGYPVAGDDQYGNVKSNKQLKILCGLDRQFLHAARLSFIHPVKNKKMTFESSLPPDLNKVQKCLEKEDGFSS